MIELADEPGFSMVAHLIDLRFLAPGILNRTVETRYNGSVASDTEAA